MGTGELMRLIVVRVIADVLHSMGPHIVRPLQWFDTDYAAADGPHCVQNAASAFISAPQLEQCTFSLSFFKCAGYLPKMEGIAIIDGHRLIWFQALPVDACRVRTVQVRQHIAAADMLNSSMNARGRIRARNVAEVYLRTDALYVVVDTPHQDLLADKLHLFPIAKNELAPEHIGSRRRLTGRLRLDRLTRLL